MLPKCCHNLSGAPLMMLILIKYHLELKKGVSNVIIEDLGVGGVAMLPIFWGTSIKHIFLQKQKNTVYVSLVHQNQVIFEFYDDFCLHYLNFRWVKDMPENRFPVKLQRAPKPWWGGGDPKLFSERVPQQHLTPQNTDKYVRTSGTGPKLGNKIFSEKKPERNLKKH